MYLLFGCVYQQNRLQGCCMAGARTASSMPSKPVFENVAGGTQEQKGEPREQLPAVGRPAW